MPKDNVKEEETVNGPQFRDQKERIKFAWTVLEFSGCQLFIHFLMMIALAWAEDKCDMLQYNFFCDSLINIDHKVSMILLTVAVAVMQFDVYSTYPYNYFFIIFNTVIYAIVSGVQNLKFSLNMLIFTEITSAIIYIAFGYLAIKKRFRLGYLMAVSLVIFGFMNILLIRAVSDYINEVKWTLCRISWQLLLECLVVYTLKGILEEYPVERSWLPTDLVLATQLVYVMSIFPFFIVRH